MIQNNYGDWVMTEEECAKIMADRFAKNGYKYLPNAWDREIDDLIAQGKWHNPIDDCDLIDINDLADD